MQGLVKCHRGFMKIKKQCSCSFDASSLRLMDMYCSSIESCQEATHPGMNEIERSLPTLSRSCSQCVRDGDNDEKRGSERTIKPTSLPPSPGPAPPSIASFLPPSVDRHPPSRLYFPSLLSSTVSKPSSQVTLKYKSPCDSWFVILRLQSDLRDWFDLTLISAAGST